MITTKDLDALAHATREEAFAFLNLIARLQRLNINPADVLRQLADVYGGKDANDTL